MTATLIDPRRPTVAELRVVAQPETVVGRASGEHWVGRLYMRHVSIYLTRVLLPTRVTPIAVTWLMLGCGIGAGLVLTIPHAWSALIAVVLLQVQGLLDCCDGELARLRGRTGPLGVYVDRLAHYVTDGGLAVAIGVHADGGLGSIGGWTALGLLAGTLVLLSKAESDLVHVARAQAGFPRLADTIAVATSHVSLVRRLRSMARRVPFNRALLGIEMSGLALAAGVVDASSGTLAATRVLDVGLVVIGVIVVVGHLLAVMSSGRLK